MPLPMIYQSGYLTIKTPKYIYIFEFKLDGSAKTALQQIEDMGYANEFLSSGKMIGCV